MTVKLTGISKANPMATLINESGLYDLPGTFQTGQTVHFTALDGNRSAWPRICAMLWVSKIPGRR